MIDGIKSYFWVGKPVLFTVAGLVFLTLLRIVFPERPLDYVGLQALIDLFFVIALLFAILLLSVGIGQKLIRWFSLVGITSLEQLIFSLPLGLGVLAYGVFFIGLLGLLHPWIILSYLLILFVCFLKSINSVLHQFLSQFPTILRKFVALNGWQRIILIASILILAASLLQALSPPADYDGLMYHLPAPELFLQEGRLLVLPGLWQANGPLAVQMLFTIGLSFGSDVFAKLIHLTFAVLLIIGTFSFANRFFGRTQAWVSVAILLGIPVLPIWAAWAYVDFAWAIYELLSLYAILLFVLRGERRWLILAGVVIGFGLGTKLLAIATLGLMILFIIWKSRESGILAMLKHSALFCGIALLIASPWYLKNWLMAGNPFYPMFFGGLEWPADRLALLNQYLYSFGTGTGFLDYLFLPWNLYVNHDQFSGALNIEIPSILFLLVFIFPFLQHNKVIKGLSGFLLLRFIVWGLGSQQTRFLLPMFPLLSVVSTQVVYTLLRIPGFRRTSRILFSGLLGGLIFATMIYSVGFAINSAPVVMGLESKESFLSRQPGNFQALQLITHTFDPDSRVFMMWDGKGYYCDHRCLPDAEQGQWTRLVSTSDSMQQVIATLREMGITHLLISGDVGFILNHDPSGQHQKAFDFFVNEFQPLCARQIFHDQWTILYEFTCQSG
jgi:hypothetical protein